MTKALVVEMSCAIECFLLRYRSVQVYCTRNELLDINVHIHWHNAHPHTPTQPPTPTPPPHTHPHLITLIRYSGVPSKHTSSRSSGSTLSILTPPSAPLTASSTASCFSRATSSILRVSRAVRSMFSSGAWGCTGKGRHRGGDKERGEGRQRGGDEERGEGRQRGEQRNKGVKGHSMTITKLSNPSQAPVPSSHCRSVGTPPHPSILGHWFKPTGQGTVGEQVHSTSTPPTHCPRARPVYQGGLHSCSGRTGPGDRTDGEGTTHMGPGGHGVSGTFTTSRSTPTHPHTPHHPPHPHLSQ